MSRSAGFELRDKRQGPGPVQAVSTSNFGLVGWLKKGPVADPTLVTTLPNFIDKFGDYWGNSYAPYIAAAFFYCGGSRAYIVREVPDDAVKASSSITTVAASAKYYTRLLDDPITSLSGSAYNINLDIDDSGAADIDVTGDSGVTGTYALSAIVGNINVVAGVSCELVEDMRGGKRLLFTSDTDGSTSELEFAPAAANDCSSELLGHDGSSTYTYNGIDAADNWQFEFPHEGEYGNDYKYELVGNDNFKVNPTGGYSKFDFVVYEDDDGDDVEVLRVQEVDLTDSDDPAYFVPKVNYDARDYVVVSEGASAGVPYGLDPVTRDDEWAAEGDGAETSFSFKTVYYPVSIGPVEVTDGVETFTDNEDGTLTGDAGGSGTVNYNTGTIVVTFNAAPALGARIACSYIQRSYSDSVSVQNTSGADGTGPLTRANLTAPALQPEKRGIYAFDSLDELLIVSVPDMAGSINVANDLITWAENEKTRFIILDPAHGLDAQEHKEYVQDLGRFDSRYAAYYAPQVKIADPVGEDRPLLVPNSGHVAGIYARTDSVRNIAKAPAGVVDGKLAFVDSVETVFDKGERDILYPANVNPIISSTLQGIALWGCRTLSRDTKWRYVQNVLTYMFVRYSLYKSSQWIVFRNNDAALWSDIRTSFGSFLQEQFVKGLFRGNKPSDAYRVVCDGTINDDESPEVYSDIYMAFTKPAEFVILRFAQKTSSTE